jgi:hypothetical protein
LPQLVIICSLYDVHEMNPDRAGHVCLSICLNVSTLELLDRFSWNLILVNFTKTIKPFQFQFKLLVFNGDIIWRPTYVYAHTLQTTSYLVKNRFVLFFSCTALLQYAYIKHFIYMTICMWDAKEKLMETVYSNMDYIFPVLFFSNWLSCNLLLKFID